MSDLHFRAGDRDDYAPYAVLHPELAVPDPVPTREYFERVILPGLLVAEADGALVAFCVSELLEHSGYVRQIVVAPSHRRRGIAERVLREVARALATRGATAWELNVKPDNAAAIALYEKLGMRRQYHSTALRLAWRALDQLPGGAPNANVTLLAARRDEDAEGVFALPSGQLAQARARGRLVFALRTSSSDLDGVAVFDPDFPGVFPFRLRAPGLARDMLEEIARHARAEHAYVNLVVEGDAELTALLRSAGAEVRLEFDHYFGALADIAPPP